MVGGPGVSSPPSHLLDVSASGLSAMQQSQQQHRHAMHAGHARASAFIPKTGFVGPFSKTAGSRSLGGTGNREPGGRRDRGRMFSRALWGRGGVAHARSGCPQIGRGVIAEARAETQSGTPESAAAAVLAEESQIWPPATLSRPYQPCRAQPWPGWCAKPRRGRASSRDPCSAVRCGVRSHLGRLAGSVCTMVMRQRVEGSIRQEMSRLA